MKCLYEAADMLEAHVVKGLLQQSRISAFIEGEHLHGAVGELPASRLVRILVNDDDLSAGQEVIAGYEADNYPLSESAGGQGGGLPKRADWLLWAALAMVLIEAVRYLF
jgi:hypothetical protein